MAFSNLPSDVQATIRVYAANLIGHEAGCLLDEQMLCVCNFIERFAEAVSVLSIVYQQGQANCHEEVVVFLTNNFQVGAAKLLRARAVSRGWQTA